MARKSKKELKAETIIEDDDDDNDDGLSFEEPEPKKEKAVDVAPHRTDPKWTKYVLGQMEKREKVDKDGQIFPRTVGLRRMVHILLGDIVSTDVDVIQAPTPENDQRATLTVSVTYKDSNGDFFSSSDASDVFFGNTPSPFNRHPVASASTKAEGRALKRLLGLNCYTAEEMDTVDGDSPLSAESAGMVTSHQLVFLEATARDKLGLNIVKFVAKHHPDCNNINSLKHGEMLTLFEVLNSYQGTEVPEELRGYDDGWRNTLGVR